MALLLCAALTKYPGSMWTHMPFFQARPKAQQTAQHYRTGRIIYSLPVLLYHFLWMRGREA
jgi:hypothetical protein